MTDYSTLTLPSEIWCAIVAFSFGSGPGSLLTAVRYQVAHVMGIRLVARDWGAYLPPGTPRTLLETPVVAYHTAGRPLIQIPWYYLHFGVYAAVAEGVRIPTPTTSTLLYWSLSRDGAFQPPDRLYESWMPDGSMVLYACMGALAGLRRDPESAVRRRRWHAMLRLFQEVHGYLNSAHSTFLGKTAVLWHLPSALGDVLDVALRTVSGANVDAHVQPLLTEALLCHNVPALQAIGMAVLRHFLRRYMSLTLIEFPKITALISRYPAVHATLFPHGDFQNEFLHQATPHPQPPADDDDIDSMDYEDAGGEGDENSSD